MKYIRGVNGGLSKVLFVHPSVDPSTKLDGSFISYMKKCNRKAIKQLSKLILTIHSPSNGTI
jgi:hypothetical protein